MRAVIYHRHDDVRIEDVPTPAIAEGELLLRVAGCGLCGSDILKLTSQAQPPVKLGHELTGTVVASLTPRFTPGQRVVVAHHVPCGACVYCQRGSPTMCAQFTSSNLDPCGLAEYVRVPAVHAAHSALRLSDSLSDEAASFTEPLACCLRALGRVSLDAVADVVVVGLGSMGLLLLQALLIARPAARLIGVDPLADRRAHALTLGASAALDPGAGLADTVHAMTDGRGADLVALTVGAPAALASALSLVRDGGELLVFAAQPGALIAFDLWACYHREVRLTTSYSSTPGDLQAALDLLETGRLHPETLISHRLPLAAFYEGVALARTHQALKVYFDLCA
ncbi:MAG TPA: alcohol dehydrogenase catalytic domain-containing protein [Ktedonobacterales bacterium]|nr:alcohol dehydrogenase catalytic domain-containing protein [Ktedonobacterales bacterium]